MKPIIVSNGVKPIIVATKWIILVRGEKERERKEEKHEPLPVMLDFWPVIVISRWLSIVGVVVGKVGNQCGWY